MPVPSGARVLVATLAALSAGASLRAEDDYIIGPRGTAMAGANTACTDDQTAQFYNPAAFGFFRKRHADGSRYGSDTNDIGRKSWGFGLDASAGAQLDGNMAQYINTLHGIDYQQLGQNGIQNLQDVQNVVKLSDALSHVGTPGNGVTVDGNTGFGMRIGHFGLGARVFFEGSASISKLDLSNLGLSVTNINTQITNSGATGDGTVQLFTPAEQSQLSSAGLSANSIQVLDYAARQQGVSAGDAAGMASLLSQIAQATNSGTGGPLSANTTSVSLRSFGLAEIPVSYGLAFGPNLSIGATLKLMIGRVYGSTVLVFQDNISQEVKDSDKQYKESINVGLDLGVLARIPHLEAGLTIHNINAPRFKGPTVNGVAYSDFRCTPQATVGVAFIPFNTLVIEGDADLARTPTTLDGYYEQHLSAGAEFNVFHFLALRGGIYKNVAESSSSAVATAGVGINLWAARLDIGGGYALKTSEFEGKKYPHEASASAGLMVDF